MLLNLLEDLTGEDDDGCGSIANFGVLRSGDVDEDSGCGVDDVEELVWSVSDWVARPWNICAHLHNGGTVVGNSLSAILINHQQVAAIGTESGLDGGLHGETGVDVGDDLTLALGSIGACRGDRVVSVEEGRGGILATCGISWHLVLHFPLDIIHKAGGWAVG